MKFLGIGSGSNGLGRLKSVGLPPPPIGIDFGASALKILQISLSGDVASLVAAAELPTPEALFDQPGKRLEWQLQELPGLLRRAGVRGKRAACSIPVNESICRILKLTKIEGMTTEQNAAQAISVQLSVPATSLVVRPIPLDMQGKTANRQDVLCMAARRETVQKLIETIKVAKFEPVGIQNEFLAMLDAFIPLSRRNSDQTANTLFLDLGFGTTKVLIAHGRDPVFAKSIEIGGRAFDLAITKLLKIDEESAHQRRLEMPEAVPQLEAVGVVASGADGPSRRPITSVTGPMPTLAEPMEMLTDELALCQRFHAAAFPDKPLSRIVFVGGEARHRAVCEHLARHLHLPAQVADPLAIVNRTGKEPTMGVDLTQPQPGWAVVLGLCLGKTDL